MGLAYQSPSTFTLIEAEPGEEWIETSTTLETSPSQITGFHITEETALFHASFVYGQKGDTFDVKAALGSGKVISNVTDEGIKTGLRSLGIFEES